MKFTITLICCIICFSAGMAVAPVRTVDKPVTVVKYVPVFQSVKAGKYFGQQRDRIAAAIPASALQGK